MAKSSVGLLFGIISWRVICFQLTAATRPPDSGCVDRGDCGHCSHAQDANSNAANSADDAHSYTYNPQSTNADSLNDNKRKWRWDPTSKSLPCNIRRISHSDLLRLYGDEGVPNLYPYPLAIYPDDNNNNIENGKSTFVNLTTLKNLPDNFPPEFHVTLTGSDSLSTHRRTIPLKQYLHEVLTANHGSGETLPDQMGNETWYLFGETFSDEWAKFLKNYRVPPCHSCTPLHRERGMIALSFGIGNIGSGVQWHLHGPGFSETIHGRKHWVLYPPEHRPQYDLDYASRHWMENTYSTLEDWTEVDLLKEKKGHEDFLQELKKQYTSARESRKRDISKSLDADGAEEQGPSNKKPWECTISPGEMIYFPDQWHHATINLEKYTVFVSSFTTEHVG